MQNLAETSCVWTNSDQNLMELRKLKLEVRFGLSCCESIYKFYIHTGIISSTLQKGQLCIMNFNSLLNTAFLLHLPS